MACSKRESSHPLFAKYTYEKKFHFGVKRALRGKELGSFSCTAVGWYPASCYERIQQTSSLWGPQAAARGPHRGTEGVKKGEKGCGTLFLVFAMEVSSLAFYGGDLDEAVDSIWEEK
ncbi:hypothetical protein AVEN_30016-1 [Araneus ventricosus]|uniref:Uncharacterized protein n=1 Tax=Araneus ventricosus TaxID=182803 RepID=A0A4Y2DV57_ARAVE|nr:hypothetical protein AVEN_30016-1 [Araneus ventricosus]